MTKTLIKKQMMEMFSFIWHDKKKNKFRTGSKLVSSTILYVVLFGIVSAMFWFISDMLCAPLVSVGLGWLYFVLMGLIAIAFGAFGSVFNTYASLYQAKDNSMLLAMPIKIEKLLLARLSGVYAMGLMYEMLVMIPVVIKYAITAKPGIMAILFAVLVSLAISIFVLTLSTVLGWGVALISSKTKHKSLMTVVLSLLFIAAYYYLYMKAYDMLQSILSMPQIAGDFIKGKLYPLYQMGLAAEGDVKALLIFTAMVLALFGIVYLVLAKSYMKIATANKGEAKKVYREQTAKVIPASRALFCKELRRFLGSPNYILNCGMGIILMLLAAVVILIKGNDMREIAYSIFQVKDGVLSLLICGMICVIATMNDISAPSVSLEGKNIWLVQVFPVSGWQVLQAKLKLHLVATWIPALLLTASIEFVLRLDLVYAILIPAIVVMFVLVMGEIGLLINLLMPNLKWTDEIVPIKQSLGVMLALFGGWVVVIALGGLYCLLREFISPLSYMICVEILLFAVAVGLLLWLKEKGSKIFEAL